MTDKYLTYGEAIAAALNGAQEWDGKDNALRDMAISEYIANVPPADVLPVPPGGIGEISDGYHTFNDLYYQRMILFAALVKQNKDRAWKSYRHSDGELCFDGGWFIVGIDAPEGSYTYHYENKDFDLFDCEELPVGKPWDGHTEKDVARLLSLPDVRPVVRGEWEWDGHRFNCSICKRTKVFKTNFCPNCGADCRNSNHPKEEGYEG